MRLSALPAKRVPLRLDRLGAASSKRSASPCPVSATAASPLAPASAAAKARAARSPSGPSGVPSSAAALSATDRRRRALALASAKRSRPSKFGVTLPTAPLPSRCTPLAAKSRPASLAISAASVSAVRSAVPVKRPFTPTRSAATAGIVRRWTSASAVPSHCCRFSASETSSAICGAATATGCAPPQVTAAPRNGPVSRGRTSRTASLP